MIFLYPPVLFAGPVSTVDPLAKVEVFRFSIHRADENSVLAGLILPVVFIQYCFVGVAHGPAWAKVVKQIGKQFP